MLMYTESEYHVVASLVRGDDFTVAQVAQIVSQDDIFNPYIRIAFGVVLSLRQRGIPAQPATIRAELMPAYANSPLLNPDDAADNSVMVLHELGKLIGAGNHSSAIFHAERVAGAATIRAAQETAADILRECERFSTCEAPELNAEDAIATVQQKAMQLSQSRQRVTARESRLDVLYPAFFDEMMASYGKHNAVTGIRTGIEALDLDTGGMMPGDLILVSGKSGGGKSAFALDTVRKSAKLSRASWQIFSYEMSEKKLMKRFTFSEARVDSNKFRRGECSDEEMQRLRDARQIILSMPRHHLHYSSTTTFSQLAAICRKARYDGECDAIAVDYLQQMPTGSDADGNWLALEHLARDLKNLAGELQVPVLALVQLTGTKVRGSEGINNYADIHYRIEVDNESDSDGRGYKDCKIFKHKMRDAESGELSLYYYGSQTRFAEEKEHYGVF